MSALSKAVFASCFPPLSTAAKDVASPKTEHLACLQINPASMPWPPPKRKDVAKSPDFFESERVNMAESSSLQHTPLERHLAGGANEDPELASWRIKKAACKLGDGR